MLVGEQKPGIGGEPLRGQKLKTRNSAYPKGEGSNLPAWVAFDRQVLCFDAYFQEAVYEKREEQYRVRNCKVYFYLEDDSIQVIEPRSKNSGVPQGIFLFYMSLSMTKPTIHPVWSEALVSTWREFGSLAIQKAFSED